MAEEKTAHELEMERLAEATEQGVRFKRKRGRPPGSKVKLSPTEYNKKRRAPRKRISPRSNPASAFAAFRREQCKDPAWRANMEEKVWGPRRRKEMPASRTGVPDGYTREQAAIMWKAAREKAETVLTKMKDKGVFDTSNLPTDDAGRAEAALRECLVIGFSDVATPHRIAAFAQVLKYCRTVSRSSKITIEGAEDWLNAAIADDAEEAEDDGSSEASEAP